MKMKLITLFIFLQFSFFFSYGDTNTIWISDLLEKPMKESFSSVAGEASYKGSSLILDALSKKEISLGIVASLEDLEAPSDEFVVYPFCFQVSSIYVADTNLVQSLSISQVRGIYSDTSDVLVSNWGDLGLSGYWKLRSVKAHAIKAMGDNSLDMVRHFSFPGEDYSRNISFWEDSETAIQQLTEEESSILIASAGLEIKGMRAVFIQKDGEDLAHPPSIDSVFFGDYSFRLPFYIVLAKEAPRDVLDYAIKLLSEEFSAELTNEKFFVLPKNERQGLVMKLQISSVQE